MFFESWSEILRVIVSALVIYPFLILTTTAMGTRSFAKMNNFDWLVTIATGSILGAAVMLKNVVLLEVIVGVSTLLCLQYCLTYATANFSKVSHVIKTSPKMVVYQGEFLRDHMKAERVSEDEIKAAIRKAGLGDVKCVQAVIFESDGELSVICNNQFNNPLISDIER
ncbi:DUF421 domain-containing protein [Alteromonas sp. SM 2104]|nr:DUF421 domain-containing protein [Alteromonas oceanisediminis]